MLTERWRVVEVLNIMKIHKYKTHKIHNSDFHINMYQFRNNLTCSRKHLESSHVIGVGAPILVNMIFLFPGILLRVMYREIRASTLSCHCSTAHTTQPMRHQPTFHLSLFKVFSKEFSSRNKSQSQACVQLSR